MRLKSLIAIACIGGLCLATSGISAPAETALSAENIARAIRLAHQQPSCKGFDIDAFAAMPHTPPESGDYQLVAVTYSNLLPSPRWLVALSKSNRRDFFIIDETDVTTWNRLLPTQRAPLKSREELTQMPKDFLRLMAVGEIPKSRWRTDELRRLSTAAAATAKQGWGYQTQADGSYLLQFFSENQKNEFSLWKLIVKRSRELVKIERQTLE